MNIKLNNIDNFPLEFIKLYVYLYRVWHADHVFSLHCFVLHVNSELTRHTLNHNLFQNFGK